MPNRFSFTRSLRGRLAFVLFIATVVPIILTGYISYRWIYIVQTEKIERDIQSNVVREKDELDRKLEEMTRISQLLDVEGGMGRDVIQYISSPSDSYDKTALYRSIAQSIANVNFANPNLGVIFYYAPDLEDPILFPNVRINSPFHIEKLPKFYQKKLLTYYGPNPSMNVQDRSMVFSLVREMNIGTGSKIYAYIETKVVGLEDMFTVKPHPEGSSHVYHVLVNPQGKIVFSNMKEGFSIGTAYKPSSKGYKVFESEGIHKWKIIQYIPSKEYNREMNKWKKQFLLFSALSLLVGILLSWFIWKMVYRPIHMINKEITHFSYDQSSKPISVSGLEEFNYILFNFHQMRGRITELIYDVEEKEKRRGQLEVEKLLVQINPHFLHNTLNTIQWLARMQGQANIAELVSIFTRVLHYNLGKKSIIVTVSEEVDAIRDYIELQNIRYDHQFKVRLDIDPDTLHVSIPRFILQPLVENALYHGFEQDEGEITVTIRMGAMGRVGLEVTDNGIGIEQEKISDLFEKSESTRGSGLGIGLRYVQKMLEVYYGTSAHLKIESKVGKGTKITISLPDRMIGGVDRDQSADRG
ncbi:sensor histidine kinase [Cohnella sp. WQ 127256]|uniref:sensor histidine kinase n=1 Tax=Cohnella sp. WQ 127256 TaxID=2938790 RepID=UPI002117647B|nr:sensor histidine kinase [Cohnella sp. WQ 127256]